MTRHPNGNGDTYVPWREGRRTYEEAEYAGEWSKPRWVAADRKGIIWRHTCDSCATVGGPVPAVLSGARAV
jgi:hypothetical protein